MMLTDTENMDMSLEESYIGLNTMNSSSTEKILSVYYETGKAVNMNTSYQQRKVSIPDDTLEINNVKVTAKCEFK